MTFLQLLSMSLSSFWDGLSPHSSGDFTIYILSRWLDVPLNDILSLLDWLYLTEESFFQLLTLLIILKPVLSLDLLRFLKVSSNLHRDSLDRVEHKVDCIMRNELLISPWTPNLEPSNLTELPLAILWWRHVVGERSEDLQVSSRLVIQWEVTRNELLSALNLEIDRSVRDDFSFVWHSID